MYPQAMPGHFTAESPWSKAEGVGGAGHRPCTHSGPRAQWPRLNHLFCYWFSTKTGHNGLQHHSQQNLSTNSASCPPGPVGVCAPGRPCVCHTAWRGRHDQQASHSLSAVRNIVPRCSTCSTQLWTRLSQSPCGPLGTVCVCDTAQPAGTWTVHCPLPHYWPRTSLPTGRCSQVSTGNNGVSKLQVGAGSSGSATQHYQARRTVSEAHRARHSLPSKAVPACAPVAA